MFCACELSFGAEPYTHTCPVCLGHPGTLPTINEQAVRYALMIAAALECDVPARKEFARKPWRGEASEPSLHRRRFARAALAVEPHVLRRQPAHEWHGVADELGHRALDADQVVEVDRVRLLDRHQPSGAVARIPAEGQVASRRIGVERSPGVPLEPALGESEDAFQSTEEEGDSRHDPES
jgi:hypothetical protein